MATWLVSGLRSPFARVDGALRRLDAVALSVPVAKAMAAQLAPGARADLVVLSANPFDTPPDRFETIRVVRTVLGCTTVYEGRNPLSHRDTENTERREGNEERR